MWLSAAITTFVLSSLGAETQRGRRPSSPEQHGEASRPKARHHCVSFPTQCRGPSCAQQHLWFEDPVDIDVTRTELHVIWEWEPGEILWTDAFYFNDWYAPSGWFLLNSHFDKYYVTPVATEHNGYSIMQNEGFPCGQSWRHWTYYNPNSMTTYAGGTVSFYYNFYAVGDCANLLTPMREVWTEYR